MMQRALREIMLLVGCPNAVSWKDFKIFIESTVQRSGQSELKNGQNDTLEI